MSSAARHAGSILVVCTGNLCRSPMAELMLRRGLGSEGIVVSSAGTGPIPSQRMDPRAASIARVESLDPDGFEPRLLTAGIIEQADLVLAAAKHHRAAVVALSPRALAFTFTLREFAALAGRVTDEELRSDRAESWIGQAIRAVAGHRGEVRFERERDLDVLDPYRRSDRAFEIMRDDLAAAVSPIVTLLRGRRPGSYEPPER